ncbi:Cyanase [Atractiella rhizophila]|nr:Cyanase [Atractiella rhizophila]
MTVPTYVTVVKDLGVAHQSLHAAKAAKGLTYAQIGEKIGHAEVFVASIFFGQARPSVEDLQKLSTVLDIPFENLKNELGEHYWPSRGFGEMPPRDPLLYRLYEMIQIFGWPLKAVINEKFGDGIMSAIDFRATVDKVYVVSVMQFLKRPKDDDRKSFRQEQGADRVQITLNGKWLKHSVY